MPSHTILIYHPAQSRIHEIPETFGFNVVSIHCTWLCCDFNSHGSDRRGESANASITKTSTSRNIVSGRLLCKLLDLKIHPIKVRTDQANRWLTCCRNLSNAIFLIKIQTLQIKSSVLFPRLQSTQLDCNIISHLLCRRIYRTHQRPALVRNRGHGLTNHEECWIVDDDSSEYPARFLMKVLLMIQWSYKRHQPFGTGSLCPVYIMCCNAGSLPKKCQDLPSVNPFVSLPTPSKAVLGLVGLTLTLLCTSPYFCKCHRPSINCGPKSIKNRK